MTGDFNNRIGLQNSSDATETLYVLMKRTTCLQWCQHFASSVGLTSTRWRWPPSYVLMLYYLTPAATLLKES
jgi:hypothetical protein